jgi:hypothetical protein
VNTPAETDEAFLARIESMVAEAKKLAFNERMAVNREDQRRLTFLSTFYIYNSIAFLSSSDCDYVLYAIECARARAARRVAERLRS